MRAGLLRLNVAILGLSEGLRTPLRYALAYGEAMGLFFSFPSTYPSARVDVLRFACGLSPGLKPRPTGFATRLTALSFLVIDPMVCAGFLFSAVTELL